MKKLLFLLIAMVLSSVSWGQSTANYTFSTATNGSLIDISAGGTSLMTGNNDDAGSSVTDIGFTFYFMGTAYTQFSANSNGQIRLGSTVVGGSGISTYSSSVPIIAPMGGDNEVNNGISYKVIGTAPNRILVVEWNQFYAYYTNITNSGNMQVLLYEGSGRIDFIYGNIYNSNSSTTSRPIFISASNTTTKSASVTVSSVPTCESTATTPVSNTFAASVPIANLASAIDNTLRVFTFTPTNNISPDNPITLTFTSVGTSSMTANWIDNSTTETFFTLTRATDAGFTTGVVTSVISSTNTATIGTAYNSGSITGLLPNTTYYFNITAGNEASAISSPALTGSQVTNTPIAYTWVATTGSASWADAASWNPVRTTPDATDTLLFNQGGSSTATSIPAQTVKQVLVSNNTAINLQSAVVSTLTMGKLNIANGSTVISNGKTAALTMAFSTGTINQIDGRLEVSDTTGGPTNVITFANSVTTIGTAGVLASGGTAAATITSTTSTLLMNGTYEHKYTIVGGAIPTATWNANSNCNIIGYTTNTTAPTGFGQNFANFTWNCTSQTGNLNLSSSSTTGVSGTFTVVSTNTGSLRWTGTGAYTLNVNNFTQTGGTFDIASGSSGSNTFNISGTFNQTGGTFSSGGTSSSNTTLNFNGIANQAVTFTTQPTGPIIYRISNPLGITLSAPFSNFNFGNGTLGGLRISTTYATPITLAGNLTTLTYSAANSTLTYDATGILTASALIFPSTLGPASLTVNTGTGYGLNIPFDRTINNTLTMTSGDIYMGNYTLTLGTSISSMGTLSYSAGGIIGNFKRWLSTATGSKDYPVGVPLNARKATINITTALTTGGTLTAKFVDSDPGTTGLPLTQGIINVNNAGKAGYWKIDAGDGLAGGAYTATLIATNFPGVNTYDSLVMLKRPSGGSWILNGTHVKTTGSNAVPTLSRTAMTGFTAASSTEFGVGGDLLKNPMGGFNVVSIATGNWGDGTTWSTGVAPSVNDYVTVSPGTTVTAATSAVCYNLTINALGTLTVSGGTLAIGGVLTNNGTFNVSGGSPSIGGTFTNNNTINSTGGTLTVNGAATTGISNAALAQFNVNGGTITLGPASGGNRTFANNGSLTVSSGTLNINGNFLNTSSAGNIFTQSGGNINVDGNAAGVAANSVAAGTYLVQFLTGTPTLVLFTGGTFTVVDPHYSSSSGYGTMYMGVSSAFSCGLGHTFAFGNGVSTDPGSTNGFSFYLYPSSLFSMGNLVINGPFGINRFVKTYSTTPILGNLTINNGGEFRASSSTYVGGDITVNTDGILTNTGTLYLSSYTSVSSVAQTISGAGAFRNLLPTVTIGAGGSGYVVGDILTVLGGTYTTQAQFIVSAVTSGAVTSVAPYGYANYSVIPTLPASTSGGTGSGCTFSALTNLAPTANLTSLTVNNNNVSGVSIGIPLSVSGTLTLTSGIVNTTATNLLTLGTETAAGTLSGGSATAYISGPFARTFAARTASGTYNATTLYPVGKGSLYLPIWMDPTVVTNPLVMKGEAFTSNSGTPGAIVTYLSPKRWEALITSGLANFNGSYVQLGDTSIVNGNQILQSASAAGVYGSIVPASLFTTGTPKTLRTNLNPILATDYNGYFAYGDLTPCTAPPLQPTALANSLNTSTGFKGTFTAPSPAPSNYLVVRYPVDSVTITTPDNYTTYTVGGSFDTHGGKVVSISGSTTFIESALTANTTYTYYVYAYNNSGCYGPVYNIASPLTATITTCATAITAPATPTSLSITNVGFIAKWLNSGADYTYVMDVATDAAFTNFVSGYNGFPATDTFAVINYLAANTNYYVRVRAYNTLTSCFSNYSGTLTVLTLCDAYTTLPWTEGFESMPSVGSKILPTCWTYQNVVGTNGPYSSIANSTIYSPNTGTKFIYTYYNATTWVFTPRMRLNAGTSYTFSFYMMKKSVPTPLDFLMDVAYGTTNTNDSMTNVLASGIVCDNSAYVRFTYVVNPTSNGEYYFGIKTTSTNATAKYISLDDFSLDYTKVPTVTTTKATVITGTTATSGGVVTDNGGAPVTARGVCYSTNADPTLADQYTSDGSGNGSYVSTLTSMGGSTLYHYRAYATNLMGTSYGGDSTFTTLNVYPPQVSMDLVSTITDSSATASGTVINDGGNTPVTPVLRNGFVRSTTIANPLIGLSGVVVDTALTPGLGAYSVGLTGLTKATLYYINAWAENSVGKAYGFATSFTTIGITTTAASSILPYSAVSGGNITTDGGNAITARGVCFDTATNPTILNTYTSDGSGMGSFVSNLTLPTASTKYYIRAYATNAIGTFYGNNLTFNTLCDGGSILSTTPATRCGTGKDTLKAIPSAGASVAWFADSLGNTFLANGSTFVTPVISTTTKYYAESQIPAPSLSNTVGLGATTSATYSNPFYSLYSNVHTQHLIPATELQAAGLLAGNITSVALNITVIGTLPMKDLSVKIGTTTATTMSSFVSVTNTVYTNASLMPTLGLNVLNFSSPFYWDGVSNIVLEFCHGNPASTATMSRTAKADATSYVSSIKTHITTSPGTSAATICGDITTNKLTYSVRPTFTFSGVGVSLCSGLRVPVIATVTPAPTFTLTGNDTVCNNAITEMSVTSTLSDYTSYVWSPAWNLYTDAAATVHYVAGTSATTVYAKTDTVGTVTYTCNATNVGDYSCANIATTKITNLEKINVAASASPATICPGGTSTLSSTASQAFNTSITSLYSFAASTSTYTPLVDATTTTATGDDGTQSITLPFAFNMAGANYNSVLISTNGVVSFRTITYTNAIASTTYSPVVAALWDDLYDDSYSSVKYKTLGVSPNRTFVIQWDSILWGISVAGDVTSTYRQNFQIRLSETSNIIKIVYGEMNVPGTTLTTIGASIGINDYSGSVNHFNSVTPGSPATNSTSIANDTNKVITYLTNGTTYTFTPGNTPSFTYSWDDSENVISTSTSVAVSPATTTIYNFVATEVSTGCQNIYPPILVTVSNFPTITAQPSPSVFTKCAGQTATITAGAAGQGLLYQWQKDGVNIDVANNATAGTATLVLDNVLVGSTGNYRLALLTDCSGTDTTFTNVAVLTVNPRPNVTPTSNTPVCSGLALNLTGTTDIGSTFKWTGPNSFNSTSQDTSITSVTSPASGIYKFIATANGCSDTATTIVVINETPTAITITPSSPTIDYGTVQSLNANGGIISGVQIFSENFDNPSSSFILGSKSGTNTITAVQNTTYYSEGISSYLLHTDTPSDTAWYEMTNSLNLTNFTSSVLTFSQICAMEGSFDYCAVQYSTDNGASWITFPTSSYAGTGTLKQSAVCFSKSSYTDWDSQFTAATSTPGTAPATSLWKTETINIPNDALSSNQFKVRFRIRTDGSVYYYGWLIDDVKIKGTGSAPFVWSPTDSLFIDAAATIPYAGEAITTVYAKPSTTNTYTATATSLVGGCSNSGSAQVAVSCPTPILIPASNVIGNTTAKLYWSSSSYNFEIECVPASASFTGVANYTLMNDYNNPHSLLLTSLAPGTDYKYQIRGECGSGYYGSWSAEGTFTTLAPQGTWTGLSTTTNNWNDAANWSGNVIPLNTDNVVIPASAPRWPHVNITPAECNDLTIAAGGYLFVDAGKALTVNGNLTNNAGATHFVLKSTYAGTASLLHYNAGVDATVERSIHNEAADEFHMLGSPVAEQAIDPNFNEVDGFFAWNEAMSEWVAFADVTNFTAVNGGGTNFVPGLGYAVSYPSLTYPGDTVKTFAGTLNNGALPLTLSSTMGSTYEGWNFVSNPYPSTIDWDNLGFTRTALEDLGDNNFPMWIWNANLGAYGAYESNTSNSTNGVNSMIPLGQGFWVKVFNTGGEFSFDNSVRTHSTQGYFKSSTATDRIRLKVSGTANTYSDEILVTFGNVSDQSGAEKMNSMYANAPNLYSTKLNKNWSINHLNTIAQHSIVPVSFKAGVNGNYTIHASELNSFATTTYVYLKDLFTNTITDLNQNSTYNFASSVTDNANRFQLIFALSPLSVTDNVIENTSIYSNNYSIYINSNETIKQIAIYNTLGQLIKTVATTNGMTVVNMKENAAGYYLVKVVTNKNVYSEKVLIK